MADRELSNALSSGELSNIQLGGTGTAQKVLSQAEIDAKLVPFINKDGTTIQDKALIKDLTGAEPSYTEGQLYYANGTLAFQGKHVGGDVEIGRKTQVEVVNNTGVTLLKGKAVRYDSIAGGNPAVVLAKADNFLNAQGLGITAHDIPNGQSGEVVTFGQIRSLDLSSFAEGNILYLSDTVAGEFTTTPPDIASSIGIVFNNDAIDGILFANPTPNIVFPPTIARNKGQNDGNYSLVAGVPSNVIDYSTKLEVISTSNILTGVINCPASGTYMFNFTFSGTLSDEEIDITVQLFSVTTASVLETHHFSSGRGSNPSLVPIADSWNVPTDIVSPNTDVVVRFTTAANETLILDEASFSMISTHIR